MRYPHLFFDLDHTLWDFERNSAETLGELFVEYELAALCGVDAATFIDRYQEANRHVWGLYNQHRITKAALRDVRFRMVLSDLGVDEAAHPPELGAVYLARCPTKPHLMPHAHATLSYLRHRGYTLHVLTNGFDETQALKMGGTGLRPFFREVITSETTGHRKPEAAYFEYALDRTGTAAGEVLMIGDSLEADIRGAAACGLDTIFYNPAGTEHDAQPTHEVRCLSELQAIL
ncbi:MAG: YjjG family noncanonical pyrimidine nucleotidase [Catalinimonas sp.]